MGIEQRIA